MPAVPAGCMQRVHPPCPAISPQSSCWWRDLLQSLGSGGCILEFLSQAAKTHCDVLLEEQQSLGVTWELPAATSQLGSCGGKPGGSRESRSLGEEEWEGGNSR